MRILHLSDSHLGHAMRVRGAPAGWSRALDHRAAVQAAVEQAGPIDLVVHTGDLFDRSRPPRAEVAAAAAWLVTLARRVPVVVLRGNHDRHGLSRTVPVTTPGLHVVDHATRVVVAGLALACVPFLADAAGWAAAARRAVGPGVDLLLCHQAVHGCQVPSAGGLPGFTFRAGAQRDTIGPQHLPGGVTHLLCGHLHPRQVVQVGAATVVMPGSTERTSFSEREQVKGAALWELEAAIRWRWLDLPSRPMVVVRGPQDLPKVRPRSLVRLVEPDPALDAAVRQAGGWPVGPPPGAPAPTPRAPQRQVGLFS